MIGGRGRERAVKPPFDAVLVVPVRCVLVVLGPHTRPRPLKQLSVELCARIKMTQVARQGTAALERKLPVAELTLRGKH